MEKWCCEFQDEVVCLETLRSHLVFEMELLGQLIAQFLVNVIAVHTDAQDNCHATTVSRRNADVTAKRSRSVGKATVCSDAFASKLDLCLHIGSHHGVDGRVHVLWTQR